MYTGSIVGRIHGSAGSFVRLCTFNRKVLLIKYIYVLIPDDTKHESLPIGFKLKKKYCSDPTTANQKIPNFMSKSSMFSRKFNITMPVLIMC